MNRSHRIALSTALAGTVVVGAGAAARAGLNPSLAGASPRATPVALSGGTDRGLAQERALDAQLRTLDGAESRLAEAIATARDQLRHARLARPVAPAAAPVRWVAAAAVAAPRVDVTPESPSPRPIPAAPTARPTTAPTTATTTGASGATAEKDDGGSTSASGGHDD